MVKDYGRKIEDVRIEDHKLTTEDALAIYDITGFRAPYVTAIRKADNVKGTLEFSHNPRFYFNFVAG